MAWPEKSEYAAIKDDYGRISRAHFSRSYFCPDNSRFAGSDALFCSADLAASIGAGYEAQCRLLCYSSYPTWVQIQGIGGQVSLREGGVSYVDHVLSAAARCPWS